MLCVCIGREHRRRWCWCSPLAHFFCLLHFNLFCLSFFVRFEYCKIPFRYDVSSIRTYNLGSRAHGVRVFTIYLAWIWFGLTECHCTMHMMMVARGIARRRPRIFHSTDCGMRGKRAAENPYQQRIRGPVMMICARVKGCWREHMMERRSGKSLSSCAHRA